MKYMEYAYKEAQKAYKKKEMPVGAIIVINDKIISKAHNNRQFKYSVLGHAEINAITKAEKKIKDWRLDNAELYVTLEPCKMCQTIINECRIKKVYYLLDQKNDSNYVQTNDCNELKNEYKKMLQNFFKNLRN